MFRLIAVSSGASRLSKNHRRKHVRATRPLEPGRRDSHKLHIGTVTPPQMKNKKDYLILDSLTIDSSIRCLSDRLFMCQDLRDLREVFRDCFCERCCEVFSALL